MYPRGIKSTIPFAGVGGNCLAVSSFDVGLINHLHFRAESAGLLAGVACILWLDR
jgi:hypothetical protein